MFWQEVHESTRKVRICRLITFTSKLLFDTFAKATTNTKFFWTQKICQKLYLLYLMRFF